MKLEYELDIAELPPIDWRKAYSERWDYSRIIETLKLAISPQQTKDFMTSDQQELELATAVGLDYKDDDDDEVSEKVLELLAHIESLDLGVIDLLELSNILTAIAVNLLEQEDTDDDDEDQE